MHLSSVTAAVLLTTVIGCSGSSDALTDEELSADARKKLDSGSVLDTGATPDSKSTETGAPDSFIADSSSARDSASAVTDSFIADTGSSIDSSTVSSGFGIAAAPALSTYLRPGYVIVAKDRVYDGYTTSPFRPNGGTVQGVDAAGRTVTVGWADGSVQKVLVGLTFKNSNLPAIAPRHVRNVLIYGCTFENIRTNIEGNGVHAINAAAGGDGPVDDVTVVASRFNRIGADGIQWGGGTSAENYRWEVAYNEFYGPKDLPIAERWGENAWDVKGVVGPIRIHHNVIDGFRECWSPKRGGTQDCSGSQGTGSVIHAGSSTGLAHNVTLDHNVFRDNKGSGGLHVNECDNIDIGPGHLFEDNSPLEIVIGTDQTTNVRISNNQVKLDWSRVILGNGTRY